MLKEPSEFIIEKIGSRVISSKINRMVPGGIKKINNRCKANVLEEPPEGRDNLCVIVNI